MSNVFDAKFMADSRIKIHKLELEIFWFKVFFGVFAVFCTSYINWVHIQLEKLTVHLYGKDSTKYDPEKPFDVGLALPPKRTKKARAKSKARSKAKSK